VAEKVLIIEDNVTFRGILSMMLQRQGYEVISADKGINGLQRATQDQPNIIILDLSLPDINGVEVLSTLKATPETSHIPVIICTAAVDQALREEVLKRGAEELFDKPVVPSILLLVLNKLSGHKKSHHAIQPAMILAA